MKIEGAEYGEYKEVVAGLIKMRSVKYKDPQYGDDCLDYEYQIFKRPYLFGLLGKKGWEGTIMTSSPELGLEFSKHLLGLI